MIGIYVFLSLILIFNLFVGYYLIKTNRFFSKLIKVKDDNLPEVLRKVLKNQEATKKEFREIYSEIARIDKEKGQCIQRVGFMKYKPFGKEEIENSFIMALLDTHGTGVVVTAVQLSDKSRVYAKEVTRGQGKQELSNEEKLAISRAMKI